MCVFCVLMCLSLRVFVCVSLGLSLLLNRAYKTATRGRVNVYTALTKATVLGLLKETKNKTWTAYQ